MNKDRTTTTIYAHSLKKGDVVILSRTELSVKSHPTYLVDGRIRATLEYFGSMVRDANNVVIVPSTISHHEWSQNDIVEILVGGNTGAGLS